MGAKRKTPDYKTALMSAQAWLMAIAKDNRNGRGEIVYDEFAYKRREQEFKRAAREALKEISKILSGDSPQKDKR